MQTAQLNQSQLLEKAIADTPVYCITRYITNCAWDANISVNEPMMRIATFFAYIECLQNHGVQLFLEPFEKWQCGPVLVGQYAYTKLWPQFPPRRISRPTGGLANCQQLIIFTDAPHPIQGLRSFQELNYDYVEWHFDTTYPYLRPILDRIFSALDKMDSYATSHLLTQLATRLFEKQGWKYCLARYNDDNAVLVSMQELKTFPLFEKFLEEITT